MTVDYFQEESRRFFVREPRFFRGHRDPMKISQWPKADLQWYLGVRCKKCRTPILFALDRSEGTGESTTTAGRLFLTCPLEKCKHQADYSGAPVARFQKTPESAADAKKAPESAKARKPKVSPKPKEVMPKSNAKK